MPYSIDKSDIYREIDRNSIDYKYYETRARCLRSITLMQCFEAWFTKKNFSSVASPESCCR